MSLVWLCCILVVASACACLLQNRGMDEATDVVVTGSSAGGLTVYLHLDDLRAMLPATAKVVGMVDAGATVVQISSLFPSGMFRSGLVWCETQGTSLTSTISLACPATETPCRRA